MTPTRSASTVRAAALAVAVLALLSVVAPGWTALAAPGTASSAPAPAFVASLLTSASSVPVGQDFSYTADIRLPQGASYLQAVFEVTRPSGMIIFKRTKLAYGLKAGSRTMYAFSRDLTGPLALTPGDYPVKLTLTGTVQGSSETTEIVRSLRVYSGDGPRVRIALVERVTGQPMTRSDGRFSLDPGQATGARDAISRISRRVLADPRVHITLSVPPVMLAEWRRLSGGYTLVDGTNVRPDNPVPVAYNATLADLKSAINTGRLDLASAGYSDPNLTDLADHGLTKDVGPQYDAGISAMFASIEATPSSISAPAGGCVPPNQVDILSQKGVQSIVVDDDCTRVGKDHASAGPYKLAHDDLHALVIESSTTEALSVADTETALDRAFERLVHDPHQPLVMSVDVDGDSNPVTDTVGVALSAIEAQPWLQLVDAGDLKPASSADSIRLVAGKKTPHAPKGFWSTVSKARSYAAGYLAAVGSSNTEASTAEMQSLVAEASSWSAPNREWSSASRGLEFADASLQVTRPVLDKVTMQIPALTLSGSSGKVPITIVNGAGRSLAVTVRLTTTGGVVLTGPTTIPMALGPQGNYLVVPVTMRHDLDGKLIVEVLAGDLVIAHSAAKIQASYLDRLAVIGAIVIAGAGVLLFIVHRIRSTPEDATEDEPSVEDDRVDDDGEEASTR